MPTLFDLFNMRPFRAVELTNAMTQINPVPTLLGTLGEQLFPTIRSRFDMIAVVKTDTVRRLIPVSPIGAPPVELEQAGGNMRPFFTRRLAKGTTVYARELQSILQMPDMQAVQTMQGELAQRAVKIRDDMELTQEHMRLTCLMGRTLDADGTTVIDDWYANWGVAQPAVIDFNLDNETTNIRLLCDNVRNEMWAKSGGSWVQGVTQVHALCGNRFFQDLITHPMVERTYLNYAAAAELRGDVADQFIFGGITFHRFRGTPVAGMFSIPDDEARFFPVGATDAFQRVFGPGEFDPFVNQPGRDTYAITIPDRDRQASVRFELYNYPLYMCLRPEMLLRGVGR